MMDGMYGMERGLFSVLLVLLLCCQVVEKVIDMTMCKLVSLYCHRL